MPEAIVARILRLPGCGVTTWEAEEETGTLTLWVRRRGEVYACGGCGRWRREVHSGRERRVRDLPWGTWAVWLVVDVQRVRCRRCGVRTERIPWLAGKARYTARLEAAVARECEQAPVSRVAARWGLAAETVRQRLPAFQKLGRLLTRHLEGILNYCHEKDGEHLPLCRAWTVGVVHRTLTPPRHAPAGPRLPRSRVPAPQGPARHRHPSSSGRMNTHIPVKGEPS